MNTNRFVFALFFGISFFLFSFIKNDTVSQAKDKFVVVLDAGHGGHDPGNLGNGYLEKNIALSIVLRTGKILAQQKDVEVVYTRKDDTFVDLFVRGEIANKANADLFVSVHCDSHSSQAYGAGTFVMGLHTNKQNFEVAKKENSVIYLEDNYEKKYADYNINSPESLIGLTIMQEEFLDQSIELAKLLQDNFTKKLNRKDRKVKQAGFIVLHQTFMPSVLVETGFLTNKDEGAYLNSEKGQQEMGLAIANAILSYKDGVDANLLEKLPNTPINNNAMENRKEEVIAATKTEPKNTDADNQKATEKIIEKKKEEVAKTATEENPEIEKKVINKRSSGITFKVQLLASSKDIPLEPKNFNGLNFVSSEPYKTMYRYLFGNTNNYEDAKKLKSVADSKGYTSSYIVAYRNNNRIPLTEALNSINKQ